MQIQCCLCMALNALEHRSYPVQSRFSCQSQIGQPPIVERVSSEGISHDVCCAGIVPPSSSSPALATVCICSLVVIRVPCREIHPVLVASRIPWILKLTSGISDVSADVDSVPIRFWIDL